LHRPKSRRRKIPRTRRADRNRTKVNLKIPHPKRLLLERRSVERRSAAQSQRLQ